MKKILVKFRINTPAGKFEFRRPDTKGEAWVMSHTKGIVDTRTLELPLSVSMEDEIMSAFGWPGDSFLTYGHIYVDEEAPNESKPLEPVSWNIVMTKEAPRIAAVLYCIQREGNVLYFKNLEDLNEYCRQRGEK